MKKLTTILAALALIISTSAFASAGENVSETVKAAFQKNYAGALNVTWQKTDVFYFAHFELNNDDISVAYNEEGELIATSQIINQSKLPVFLAASLKDQYGEYSISPSVSEINFLGEVIYFISAENKNSVLRLKCSADGAIVVEKKIKKTTLVGRVF